MIQITPQMKVLVALEPADFRKGIDGLARVCKDSLQRDPFEGTVFVFRNRRSTAIKILVYDGQGFWLCQKRMSEGRFRWWPTSTDNRLGVPCQPLVLSRKLQKHWFSHAHRKDPEQPAFVVDALLHARWITVDVGSIFSDRRRREKHHASG